MTEAATPSTSERPRQSPPRSRPGHMDAGITPSPPPRRVSAVDPMSPVATKTHGVGGDTPLPPSMFLPRPPPPPLPPPPPVMVDTGTQSDPVRGWTAALPKISSSLRECQGLGPLLSPSVALPRPSPLIPHSRG